MRPAPKPAKLFTVATFECGCSTTHHSADGQIPVGWTQRQGIVWCTDCTRLGIPVRTMLSGGHPRRSKPTTSKPTASKSAA